VWNVDLSPPGDGVARVQYPDGACYDGDHKAWQFDGLGYFTFPPQSAEGMESYEV
jgi:hypothetical protein